MSEEDVTPSLVRRLRAGDAEAAERLDRLFRAGLVRFCVGYLGSVDLAEDAVQEVLAKAWKSDVVPERFRVWLYTVARNHCLNVRRGLGRRRDGGVLPTDVEIAASCTGMVTRLARREEVVRIERLVAALSESQREIIRMRYGEDLSREEIAEILELAPSVVKSRLYEAMKTLRARAGDA